MNTTPDPSVAGLVRPHAARASSVARACLAAALLLGSAAAAPALDLKSAVLVTAPGAEGPRQAAVRMLVGEIEKRTGIQLSAADGTNGAGPVIVAAVASDLAAAGGPWAAEIGAVPERLPAEGFRLRVEAGRSRPVVFILGNDARGLLFGIGRFLREMHAHKGSLDVADDLNLVTAPRYPLRGHQLGYRPKSNTYDAWDLPAWEQYFRDLAVFGCNAVELIPPRSDDAADSPHFPRPQLEMMQGMSRLADQYGLDAWIWYPALDKDYADDATVEAAVAEWGKVFAALPRVDAVFVPGGDPGHTRPDLLLRLLERQTTNLHRYHPRAGMWVSPQGFTQEWFDQFISTLQKDQPRWLTGVVCGPQVRLSPAKLRQVIPAQYAIRSYPDITHSRQCQYPVPDWDTAFAVTEGRECINPRPLGEALICRQTSPPTVGFITYSEGSNDDVNKMVWSALGWEPEASVTNILRQYCRYLVDDHSANELAEGLLGLERDWQGPLAANLGVADTFARFRAIEHAASPAMLRNWRFQQPLLRAYYDAYIQKRLAHERRLEDEATAVLAAAPRLGATEAMAASRRILNRVLAEPVEPGARLRIYQLAEALFQSIGMQLSVSLYQAIDVDRGASLDTLDFPLNNRLWLEAKFDEIAALPLESARLVRIQSLVEWTNAGPGGFYDDLGNPVLQPHLVRGPGPEEDPGCFASTRSDFEEEPYVQRPGEPLGSSRRYSWLDHVESLYDQPIRMSYEGLDPTARYRVRVVYGGDEPEKKIRLVANDQIVIHPYRERPWPIEPLEFPVSAAATRGGRLDLAWYGEPGKGGNGRSCQLSEVWLIKETLVAPAGTR